MAIEDAGWPTDIEAPNFGARGYDPMITMATLEEILTGRGFDLVTEDSRSGGTPAGSSNASDSDFVLTLTDSLRDALAAADDNQLQVAAKEWAETDELSQGYWHDSTVADHLKFIQQLQDLARQAVAADARLYCFASL